MYCVPDLLPTVCCQQRQAQYQCSAALFWQNAFPTVQSCTADQVHSRFVSVQLHLWRFAVHTAVQRPNPSAVQHCFWPFLQALV